MDTQLHLPAPSTLYKTELSFFILQRGGFCVPSTFRKIPSKQRPSCNSRTRRWKYQLISLKSTSRIVERNELIQSILLGRFGSVLFTDIYWKNEQVEYISCAHFKDPLYRSSHTHHFPPSHSKANPSFSSV